MRFIWSFYLLHDTRYIDFQNGHFADFEQIKSNLTLLFYFTNFGQVTVALFSLSKMLGCKKQEKQSKYSVWQKIKEPCIRSGTSHFQWFNQQESRTGWIPQSKNTLQRLNLLFLSVTYCLIVFLICSFLDTISKIRIHNPTKSLWWRFFAKILNVFELSAFFVDSPAINVWLCSKNVSVACKEKRNKLYYMILHNFI